MSLPTLKSAYMAHKFDAHEALAARREQRERDYRQHDATARYFNNQRVITSKQRDWSSRRSFETSMRAWQNEAERDLHFDQLAERRLRLMRLLNEESAAYKEELSHRDPTLLSTRYDRMRAKVSALRTERETERKQLAESKLKQAWLEQNPRLRAFEASAMTQRCIKDRKDQIEASDARRKEQEQIEEEEARKRDAVRREEALQAKREARLKLERERHHKKELQWQAEELKRRDEEAEAIQKEYHELLMQQQHLEKEEEERRMREARQQQIRYSRALRAQHKEQMLRKSHQIQQEMEEDMQLLEMLYAAEDKEKDLKEERRARAVADVAWMQREVENQLTREKRRQAEIDALYREEASRMYAKQEAQWERERMARERLMKQVLAERRQQLEEKMERVMDAQNRTIREREALLATMQRADELDRGDAERRLRQREKTIRELDAQVRERAAVKEEEVRQRAEEKLQHDYLEELEDEAIIREIERRRQMLRQEGIHVPERDYGSRHVPDHHQQQQQEPSKRRVAANFYTGYSARGDERRDHRSVDVGPSRAQAHPNLRRETPQMASDSQRFGWGSSQTSHSREQPPPVKQRTVSNYDGAPMTRSPSSPSSSKPATYSRSQTHTVPALSFPPRRMNPSSMKPPAGPVATTTLTSATADGTNTSSGRDVMTPPRYGRRKIVWD